MKKCILTTSNINYISRVNVLTKSILKNHGDIEVYNIIVDDYSESTKKLIRSKDFSFKPIFLDELEIEKVRDLTWMTFQYDTQDLNTAAKPFGFKYLFKKGYDQVLYFDCDIEVFSSLDNLFDKLNENSFVLTPHFTLPLPDFDGASPTDNLVNRCGQFNLGFIGISNKENGNIFVDYWCSKTKKKFNVDLPNGLFTDQVWCNLIPSFFSDYYIDRGFEYNIAYWNLAHRDSNLVKSDEGKPYMLDKPVVFIHYSGIDINDVNELSKHQNVLKLSKLNFKYFHNDYIKKLKKEIKEYEGVVSIENKFDNFSDNSVVLKCYRDCVIQMNDSEFKKIKSKYPNPFDVSFKKFLDTKGVNGFGLWMTSFLRNRADVAINCISKLKFNSWRKHNNI